MTDLVKRLRQGCDCSEKVCEMDTFSELAADRIEELEAKLVSERTNALDCLSPHCEEHTGENTPPFAEWTELMKNRCPICDGKRIEELEAEIERLNMEYFSPVPERGNFIRMRPSAVTMNWNFLLVMSQTGLDLKPINVGERPNDMTGDYIRTAMIKINENFKKIENHFMKEQGKCLE